MQAILDADLAIIGPGSLFTSVLAVAAVPDVRQALAQTEAVRIFVANVANDKGEARGFDLPEHLETLAQHGIAVDVVIAQTGTRRIDQVEVRVVVADVGAADGWGHDARKLGPVLQDLATR